MQFCSRCQRRMVVSYHVEPEEAWRTVVLNRWPVGKLCAQCFDAEAQRANVAYSFVGVTAQSWSEEPPPRNPYKRKS
jgi:hypothetical protein